MNNFYDKFSVGTKVEKKVYVNKVDSLISGLETNIAILKKRGDLTLKMIKGSNGKDSLLPERDQWWSKDANGDYFIRLESKGKKVYLSREVALKHQLVKGGRDVKSVLSTYEEILSWVKSNVDLDTELFYWTKDKVTGERNVVSL
jgi:hypothetical protein